MQVCAGQLRTENRERRRVVPCLPVIPSGAPRRGAQSRDLHFVERSKVQIPPLRDGYAVASVGMTALQLCSLFAVRRSLLTPA